MIAIDRNLHLYVTIVLIIVVSSDELPSLKNRGLREIIGRVPAYQGNEPKTQSDLEFNGRVPTDLIYYNRNDIRHLDNYYQERLKLREEYDAIQKSMQEKNRLNRTISDRVQGSDKFKIRIPEDPDSLNANSLQAFHALNPDDENSIKPSRPLRLDSRMREENNYSNIQNNNTEVTTEAASGKRSYVKMGECRGSQIYNQNLIITRANYQAMNGYLVGISLEGICITCVEITSIDNKEIKVKVVSGGPGKGNISLKFEGFDEFADFTYTLKIWAVGGNC